ncbi:hypothetical protein CANINC_003001 [Pichia inconspicua]|uniref:TTI1 N-terminal TPR domain-containing protein n=1 Tax=Pichia inconspicua TaxID=52247 RepID=A0A4V4NFK3_9ASCO|nr:hypothetical protein CANINC_003001 [[Candida] inconspicua]
MSLKDNVSLFKDIRPKCVQLAELVLSNENKSGSLKLLNALKDLHSTLRTHVDDLLERNGGLLFLPLNLSDYIMVPITTILKNDSITDSELEHISGIVYILLKYSFCQPGSLNTDLFTQYITLFAYLIGGKPGQFSIGSHSDESYLNCLLCINTLIYGATQQNTNFSEKILDNMKFVPTLGFLVSVLLNIAVESSTANVKRQSLEALNSLFHLLNNGEVLSLFFPGTVSSIAKVIKSNPRNVVVEESFRVLTTIVTTVFCDFDLGVEVENQELSLDSLQQNIKEDIESHEMVQTRPSLLINIPEDITENKTHRTQLWLESTIVQFEKALQIILKIDLNRYSKLSVREAIYQFDVRLIRNCFFSCQKVLPLLIKSLSEISTTDFSFMKEVIDSLVTITDVKLLRTILEKLLLNELETMQYNFVSPDSSKVELMLGRVNFLLNILNNSGGTDTIIVESLFGQLHDNLSHLCISKLMSKTKCPQPKVQPTMETQLKLVSAQYDTKVICDVVHSEIFNGIVTRKCEKLFIDVLSSLSFNVHQLPVNNYVLQENPNANLRVSIYYWMFSVILSNSVKEDGAAIDDLLNFEEDDNELQSSIEAESQVVMINKVYDTLESSTCALKESSISHADVAGSITTVMCLRSIHNAMLILKDDFEEELIDVLYPIVECLASPNETIRSEAQIVALEISKSFYGGSVERLLFENSDYLLDSLSSKLTGELLTPNIAIILSILVKLGSMDLLAELDDIIRTIFTLLDIYFHYPALCEGFFLAFNEIITKIYQNLDGYSFDALASNLEEDNVINYDMWGLDSAEKVEEFMEKKASFFDDLVNESDDEIEEIKGDKILEIDSDDSDNESDRKSRTSYLSNKNADFNEDESSDETSWVSPLKPKLYNMLSNILAYAERLLQTKHTSLEISLLKTMKRIVPLLATQNTRFLPFAVSVWDLLIFLIKETEDHRIIGLCLEVFHELIKFGSTFFTTRFIELYKTTTKNMFIQNTIYKQREVLKQRININNKNTTVINRTSTSTNWEFETYSKMCNLLIFAMQKLGRFIPTSFAISMISYTIYFDDNVKHYCYFEELVEFVIDNKELMNDCNTSLISLD